MTQVREFDLLTNKTIHAHIAPFVEERLLPLGFVEQKPLHWVCSTRAPVRLLFCYEKLKGGVVAPCWGYSLDFVPHLAGGKVKWHKTEKSAMFDAFVDGQSPELNIYYMWGLSGLLEGMAQRIDSAITSATQLWELTNTELEMSAWIEGLRAKPRSAMHTQLPLANAFCLARRGLADEGRREIASFAQSHGLDETVLADLNAVFDKALDGGGSSRGM